MKYIDLIFIYKRTKVVCRIIYRYLVNYLRKMVDYKTSYTYSVIKLFIELVAGYFVIKLFTELVAGHSIFKSSVKKL